MKTVMGLSSNQCWLWRFSFILLLVGILAVAGCATKGGAPVSEEDTPVHHYARGMQALEKGDFALAGEKFDRALSLEKKYAPGLAGKALVLAVRSVALKEAAHREVDVKEALRLLKRAKKNTESKAEKFIVYVTGIRVYFMAKPKNWIDKANDFYQDAKVITKLDEADLPYYRNKEAADYFMAVALFRHDYLKAEPLLSKVLAARSGGKWQQQADTVYRKLQKIKRASANRTLTGKARNIAIKDQVTRGDVAALLADELKLDSLFAGRIPVRSQEAKRKAEFTPADIVEHPFRGEIETLMKWEVRGLIPAYDSGTRAWLFHPQSPVTRKELALVLEDVLIKLTGDEELATAMLGMERSPFPDVKPEVAWFNSVMTVTSRNLMEAGLSGEFRPDDATDGADLLLAVFTLRNVLNIH